MIRTALSLAALACTSAAIAESAWALQAMPADALSGQSLRAYWHVFIAYALVLVLVGGYVFSIARRLAEVEKKLGE